MDKAVSVHARVRPHKPKDGLYQAESLVVEAEQIMAKDANGSQHTFKLDRCHGISSTQQEIFEHVQPLIERVYEGYNATVFAYGVTGSGKTHTMQGTDDCPGIIPRTVKAVFARRESQRKQGVDVHVSFSYVEILKDEVYDLLTPSTQVKKVIPRADADGNVIIADLTLAPISSMQDFEFTYQRAAKLRKTASTKLNSTSSRSHAILSLHVRALNFDSGQSTYGKICLTDLAGSENNNLTGNDPERMRESTAINQSLTTLRNVIEALQKKASRIPYRDSKLTRMLQDALGGNCIAILFCCLAPGNQFVKDTIATLNFATRTKQVKNRLSVSAREITRPSSALGRPRTRASLAPAPRPASALSRPVLQDRGTSNIPRARLSLGPTDKKSAIRRVSCGEDEPVRMSKVLVRADNVEVLTRTMACESALCSLPSEKTKSELPVHPALSDHNTLGDSAMERLPKAFAAAVSNEEGSVAAELHGRDEPMTDRERADRARTLVGQARKHHGANNLKEAMQLYQLALQYAPDNNRLRERVAGIKLAIEGHIPVPELSIASRTQYDIAPSRESHLDVKDPGSASKRKRPDAGMISKDLDSINVKRQARQAYLM